MATEQHEPVTVEIFGASYTVRGGHDREHLEVVAGLVDTKMRELASRLGGGDAGRLAILVALNLADELLQLNRQRERERVEFEACAVDLTTILERALAR